MVTGYQVPVTGKNKDIHNQAMATGNRELATFFLAHILHYLLFSVIWY